MLAIRTILVPTDFSSTSADVLALAVSLARDHGARLVLLHVAGEPTFAAGMGMVPFDANTYRDDLSDQLDQLAVHYPDVAIERRLVAGHTVAEVLRVAEETECDLIVLGSHGFTGFERLVLGSVAEGVMRKAPCPVLTVRASLPRPLAVAEPALAAAK